MAILAQLMSKELSVIPEEASVQEAAHLMQQKRIGSLLVEKAGEYCGIITETDVVQAVAEQQDLAQLKVGRLMSSPIITVDQHLSPHYARDLMADRRIRHLAVTDGGKIVGVISVRDLLSYFKTMPNKFE
ncbi:MAG: CBS domain-containing protein [Nitrospirae bacterium]|nr:MAG: CBS domain-containing protein [Nitrospirota bacterium]